VDTLLAIASWVSTNAPLPAVTGENASKPHDYWLNLKRLQALHLNGVLFARYTDMSITMGLGQLSNNANTTIKNALVPVLKEMDRLDTKVTCCTAAQPPLHVALRPQQLRVSTSVPASCVCRSALAVGRRVCAAQRRLRGRV
jgi:hypothetical protein